MPHLLTHRDARLRRRGSANRPASAPNSRPASAVSGLLALTLVVAPSPSVVLGQTDEQAICEGTASGLTVSREDALFTVSDLGDVQLASASDPRVVRDGKVVFRVLMEPRATDVWVRVDLVNPSTPATPTMVACGEVNQARNVVQLDAPTVSPGQRRLLRFSVFRPVLDREMESWTALRAGPLESLETDAHAARYRENLRRFLLSVPQAPPGQPSLDDLLDPNAAPAARDWARVEAFVCAMRSRALRAARGCGQPRVGLNDATPLADFCNAPTEPWPTQSRPDAEDATIPYPATTCETRDEVLRALRALYQEVCPPAGGTPPTQPLTAQCTAVAPTNAARDELYGRVHGVTRLPTTEQEAICSEAARPAWLRGRSNPQRTGLAEVPLSTARVMTTVYDDGASDYRFRAPLRIGGLVVRDVPRGQALAFRQYAGDTVARSLADVLRFALAVVPPALGRGAPAGNPCARVNVSFEPPSAPPLSLTETRAYPYRSMRDGRQTVVQVCNGSTCVPSGDSANVRNTLELTPLPRWDWFIGFEAGVAPGALQLYPDIELAYTSPSYRAAGGTQGPQQLFVLDSSADVGSFFTLSAIAGGTYRFDRDHRLLIGIAAVLSDANGSRSFTELGLRFGIEVTRNVFITTGTDLAVLPRVQRVDAPETVAVTRASEGTVPDAPSLATSDGLVLRWVVGLTFDLRMFGEAAKDVVAAIDGD